MAIITKEGEHGALREALVQNLLIFGVAAPSVMLNYINSMLHVHLNHDNAKKMQAIQPRTTQVGFELMTI